MQVNNSIDQFSLVLQMTFRSVYNKTYFRRLLGLFIIPSILTIGYMTTHTIWNEQGLFFEFAVEYSQSLYTILYVVVAVVGWIYSTSSFKTQVNTLTSHPISRSIIFFCRQILLIVTIFFIQLFYGITLFAEKMTMEARPELKAESLYLFIKYSEAIILASIVIAIIFVSVMSIIHIACDKSSVAFGLGIIGIIIWDGLTGISLKSGLYSNTLVPFPTLGPAALLRNLLLQTLWPIENSSVIETGLGFYFTLPFLIVQIAFFGIIVYISTFIAWKLFLRKSKTW